MSNILKGLNESSYRNYDANRTGFSRGHRDDERHDLDIPTQVWGLKINGKVWSKNGKDVTFNSKQAALNIRNSILKNRPDLEIGLVTKGGVNEGFNDDNFTIADIKELEKINDFATLKARAKELIKGKPARRMKPEKIAYFYDRVDTLTSPMKVIKLMYDLLLAGEGMKTIGSRNDMNPNVYQRRFAEADEQLDEISTEKLAKYKTAAAADAKKADSEGDYKRGDKRFSGIVKATKKQFANDEKQVKEDEEELDENLHKWFKEKWVRFGPDGKIRGDCARGDDSEGKPKCLPQSKAHSLGKKGRASAASRKRREDPNPERSGKAINVNTKKNSNESVVLGRDEGNFVSDTPVNLGGVVVKNLGIGDIVSYFGQKAKIVAMSKTGNTSRITIPSGMGGVTKDVLTKDLKRTSLSEEELDEACWKGYHKEGNKKMFGKTYTNCVKNTNEEQEHHSESCPHCGGEMVSEELMNEKKDACYYKVKSRYKVWPSAYASGALVKCRKKGASNWGNGGKSNESVAEDDAGDVEQRFAVKMEKEKQRLAKLKQTDPEAYKREMEKHKQTNRIPPVSTFEDQGVAEDQLDEKWTKKYKDSINCSNPKGFSQKAHCAGKQKNESAIMSGLNQLDEGWKEKLGAAALAGSMALGAGAAHGRVTPDGQGGFTGGLKPTATVTSPSDNKPAAEAPKGFSKEYLQSVIDGKHPRPMVSVEKAKELLKSMP